MKNRRLFQFAGVFQILAICFSAVAFAAGESSSYKIASGDVLEIIVVDHTELSAAAPVVTDGTISLSLVGSVAVEGLTVDQVRVKLEDLYNKNYIANPSVSVNLKQSRPKQFYVNGEVKLPGVYGLHDDVTVLKAIIMAGGFTDYASKKGVKVLRTVNGKEEVLMVNVAKVEGGELQKDFYLMPEDIIIVPQSIL